MSAAILRGILSSEPSREGADSQKDPPREPDLIWLQRPPRHHDLNASQALLAGSLIPWALFGRQGETQWHFVPDMAAARRLIHEHYPLPKDRRSDDANAPGHDAEPTPPWGEDNAASPADDESRDQPVEGLDLLRGVYWSIRPTPTLMYPHMERAGVDFLPSIRRPDLPASSPSPATTRSDADTLIVSREPYVLMERSIGPMWRDAIQNAAWLSLLTACVFWLSGVCLLLWRRSSEVAIDMARLWTRDLRKLAWVDPLTQLLSRARSLEVGREWLSRKQPLLIFFIDLDGFKKVNDTLGHEAGDAILREYARRLSDIFSGERDVAVGRLGGDEFLVIHRLTPEGVQSLMAPVQDATKSPMSQETAKAPLIHKAALNRVFTMTVKHWDLDLAPALQKINDDHAITSLAACKNGLGGHGRGCLDCH